MPFIRLFVCAAILVASLQAQFDSLSATADGSSVHFVSTLRLKNSPRLLNGKVFSITPDGVQLVRGKEPEPVPPDTPSCGVGGFQSYLSVENSRDAMAFVYRGDAVSFCSFPPNTSRTQIITPNGEMELPGIATLSADGRRAVQFLAHTLRYEHVEVYFVDTRTGEATAAEVPPVQYPQEIIQAPFYSGRIVANDGTTLLNTSRGAVPWSYILRPGMEPEPFPVDAARSLAIDAGGAQILYERGGLYLLDLRSGHSVLLAPKKEREYFQLVRMSDDAARVIFVEDGQLHLVETGSGMRRQLTDEPFGVLDAAISGDGETVFAASGQGRLLRFDSWTGSRTELIGKTPYVDPDRGRVIPGLVTTLRGSGLSDSVINGKPPFDPYLGKVTMWIGERKVPMVELTPNTVKFLVPWDLESEAGKVRLLVEAPGENTPFYYPEVITEFLNELFPRAGAIARQDWTQTYVGPVSTGEIIHVYAIGFGPTSPEVPAGAVAPMTEPFPRLTQTLSCSNAEILYAGLAPGTVERIYQIDIRIGPRAGYQQFHCTLGNSQPFIFLTLNVLE